MTKNLFDRIISVLLVLIMVFTTGLFYIKADAAIKSVDPSSDVFDDANSLLIQKYPDIKGFSYTTNIAGSRMNVYEKNASTTLTTSGGAGYFGGNFKTQNYISYLPGYAAFGFEVKDGLKSTDYIKIIHQNVGTYDGSAVDMIVTYTGFVQRDNSHYIANAGLVSGYSYLDISANPYNGYIYSQIDYMTINIDFVHSGTSTAVDVTGAYLSFNSLNGPDPSASWIDNQGEWVNYQSADVTSTADAYITTNTNLKYESASAYSAYTSYTGNAFIPQSNNFTDTLGADTFTKNSVSFKLTGTTQTFTVGAKQTSTAWNTFSSALLVTAKGVEPTKEVDKSFAAAGETLTYSINQKVHTLGQDLLTKYQSFVFTDALPDEVEYVSAKLVGEDGTDYSSYGTAAYDASTHTVKFTANSNFLNNVVKYEAETYTLVITTKVKSSITKTTTITNTGKVNIDGINQTTNEVETLVSPFPPTSQNSITKSIKTSSGNVKEYTLGNYSEDIAFVGTMEIQNKNNLTSVVISDTLNDNLTFKSLKIYNSAGKEITSYGTPLVSGQKVTFTFATSYLSAIAGDTLTAELAANYNGKTSFADMTNNKITNTMTLTVNGTNTNSNEVSINSPVLKIEKYVDKSEIQVGDTAAYTIKVTNTIAGTTAKNVVVSDTSLPTGFEYVSAAASGVTAAVTQSGNGFTAKAASLAYGDTLTITYKVKATSAANGATTTNTAYASADNADETSSTAKVFVNTAKFAINKTVSDYEWQVGDVVDYTVEVRNTASGTIARNVVISDISLPEGLKVDGEIKVNDSGVTVTKEGTGFKAACSELPYNKTITITFTCTATEAVNGEVITNTATVSGDNGDPQDSSTDVYINSPKLSIEKVSSKNEWKVGDMVDYTVTVKNTIEGTSARNAVVSDISLPAGLAVTGDVTVKGVDKAEVSKTSTGFIIKVPELAYGAAMVITYECKATEAVNGTYVTNTATAVADNADTVEDQEKVYINSPKLTVEKVSSANEWRVGDMVDYTITVNNTAAGTIAKNVVITDVSLPEGLAVTGSITVNGADAAVTKEGTGFKVECAALSSGKALTITFECEAKEAVNGTNVENKVTVDSDNDDPRDSSTVVYINSPELTIEKAASANELKVGDKFDYTITATNTKKGTVARNVVISDNTLPDYIEVSGNNIVVSGPESLDYEVVKDGNGFIVNIAELQGEETVEITVPCIVNEGAAGKEVVNTVTVTSDNADDAEDKETVWVNNPDLEIVKMSDKVEKVYQVGDSVTYRLIITNNAAGTVARNVMVSDTIETEGVELQKNTIVLKDGEGNVITPQKLTVEGNNFTMETGVNLVNSETYTVYEGEEVEQDTLNPLDETNYTVLNVEYQVKIVSSALNGKEVYNVATVTSDEDLPDEDDETITVTASEKTNASKTGDTSRAWLFVVLIILAAVVSGGTICWKRKR
ncbi:MAG: isopeptide-forming domain-containing fimbrial protein [Lachnospiraceae bacterium]